MNTASKEAVDSLLPYLNDSKPEFRDTIQSMIKSLVGQEFDTYEQGKAWWDSNRDKLGNDLKPLILITITFSRAVWRQSKMFTG